MVVRTVPGTVAGHQSRALYAACEMAPPSAFTLGAGVIRQPPARVHSPSPWDSRASCAAGGFFATGRENGALLRGMVAGSCGARYPACPRVCTGHGFDPSSKAMVEKLSGFSKSRLISSLPNALRTTVTEAMDPPKWRQFGDGKKGGAICRTGLTLPESNLPLASWTPSL